MEERGQAHEYLSHIARGLGPTKVVLNTCLLHCIVVEECEIDLMGFHPNRAIVTNLFRNVRVIMQPGCFIVRRMDKYELQIYGSKC